MTIGISIGLSRCVHASIAGNLLEPDPSIWDDERIARVCDALDGLAPSGL